MGERGANTERFSAFQHNFSYKCQRGIGLIKDLGHSGSRNLSNEAKLFAR